MGNVRHFLCTSTLTSEEIKEIFELARVVKKSPKEYANSLKGKTLAMIFEKPSTRTRVSFEVGMLQLGGHALYLSANDLQLGRGESIEDTAKTLSRYVDFIMARVYQDDKLRKLAENATVPVINGLSNDLHPCQALADFFTISEIFGELRGRKFAYLGDGNNVAHSLMLTAPLVGMDIYIASPEGYWVDSRFFVKAQLFADAAGTRIVLTRDPKEAVMHASVVYTDVWASMGQESESVEREKVFADYQVNYSLFSLAAHDAIFMHCLPAYRGKEVTDEVIDSPQSVVFDQAENRLHVQKAILIWLNEKR